ncbi:polyprenyl synthetase family protein [Atopobacter phocae]|uniref:polyprenyl synthetase family protein n=1 Tax=Atopobacter phocae TaxID=136492 RepID=UPI000470D0BA|nr:polyprenyl synthetase family protein [Atopobacter phocae]
MTDKIFENFEELDSFRLTVQQTLLHEIHLPIPDMENKIKEYVNSSGKYLRASYCYLFSKMADRTESSIIYTACALETFHLATLIHDDVIDQSDTRRHVPAMHVTHSNRVAIYSGDYLFGLMFKLLHQTDVAWDKSPYRIPQPNKILTSELRQLDNQFNVKMTIRDYLHQIKGKTARLFGAACFAGRYDEQASRRTLRLAFQYGELIGMVFQLVDDLMDYQSTASAMGKAAGQDVQNGIFTAPLLFAIENDPALKDWLKDRRTFSAGDLTHLSEAIERAGGFDATRRLIDLYQKRADVLLNKLGPNVPEDIRRLSAVICQRNY